MATVEQLYNEWISLQPVDKAVQASIDQKFMLEFNYNSNHIEGNTLTYGQTELLLMFGQVDSDAKMSDLEEMKAHNVCLKMIQEEAGDAERPLTEYFIRQLHKTLLREDYEVHKQDKDGNVISYVVHAGKYKTRPNSVITPTGERFEYASPEETPSLMSDLVSWYNDAVQQGNLSPIEMASLFHYRYIRIHPFEDGNGRIARLLVNYVLLRANYPMIVIRSDDKEKYLSVLNQCDVSVGLTPAVGAAAGLNSIFPFVEYMKECLHRALDIRIRAAKGESIEEEDDWKKKIALKLQQRKDKPARTRELTTKAVREAFIPAISHIAECLEYCKSICFGIEYTVYAGKHYQNYYTDLKEFTAFAEKNSFKYHLKLYVKIRVAEFLPEYDVMSELECCFNEFGYELVVKVNKTPLSIKFRYGMVPSMRQLKQLSSCIGNHIYEVYERYCEDNDND